MLSCSFLFNAIIQQLSSRWVRRGLCFSCSSLGPGTQVRMDGRVDEWAGKWMKAWVDGINDAEQRLGLGA